MVYGLHLNFWPIICKGSPASMDAFAHDVSHLTLFFFFFFGVVKESHVELRLVIEFKNYCVKKM